MNDTEKKAAAKSKTHQKYFNKAGVQVPGCTTITGVMNKPFLVKWANSMGLKGIDTTKYVDELATIGTLTHYMVECWLLSKKCELGDFTANQIEAAKKSFMKFIDLTKEKNVKVGDFAVSEGKLVSEKHQFGGTIDACGVVEGVPTLIDLKTSKAVYGEHLTQVAGGYRLLCEEAGYGVEQIIILRIGRDEQEGFEAKVVPMPVSDLHVRRFIKCRELYELNKLCGD
jgi:hypothetical protein